MRNVGAVVILCAVTWIYLTMANEDDSTQDLEPGLNRYCKKRDDCPKFGYWCDGNMTCQCAGMYIPNQAKTNCIGGIGQKCSYDIDCIPKAYCHMQTKCKCKDKYHPTDDGLACKIPVAPQD